MSAEYSVESLQHLILSQHASTSVEAIAALRAFQERIKADDEAVPVAWQFKRRPEDYPDEWSQCSKEHYDACSRREGSPWIYRELFAHPPAQAAQVDGFDMLTHLQRQREWSGNTFGPGARAQGVVDHIRKELCEIEADPGDLKEWIDVVILALDGAWRSGAQPQEIIDALVAKQARNEGRVWPDWRTADPTKAIEHDRSHDAPTAESVALPRCWDAQGNPCCDAPTAEPAAQVDAMPEIRAWLADYADELDEQGFTDVAATIRTTAASIGASPTAEPAAQGEVVNLGADAVRGVLSDYKRLAAFDADETAMRECLRVFLQKQPPTQPHSPDAADSGRVSASELQQLEYDIGQGKYTAPWVFTRMKQYIQAAQPRAVPDGIAVAAEYIQKKADAYAEENCGTEWDTGATTYHYGQAGEDYHHGLLELVDELTALATAPSPGESE